MISTLKRQDGVPSVSSPVAPEFKIENRRAAFTLHVFRGRGRTDRVPVHTQGQGSACMLR
jgi:hypothetical protein